MHKFLTMEKDTTASPHPANSQTSALGPTSDASPVFENHASGQSVENALSSNLTSEANARQGGDENTSRPSNGVDPSPKLHWYVIRATHGRAQAIYDTLTTLPDFPYEVYIPRYHVETLYLLNGTLNKHIEDGLLYKGLVFVRMPYQEFHKLVHALPPYPFVKGLTPYYNHFHVSSTSGRNEYLIVPDHQFHSFRTLLESRDTHILIDQAEMPTYLQGKKVEIIDGPFKGVTGSLLRWKGLRRVFIRIDQIGTFATGFIRTCDFRLIEE